MTRRTRLVIRWDRIAGLFAVGLLFGLMLNWFVDIAIESIP